MVTSTYSDIVALIGQVSRGPSNIYTAVLRRLLAKSCTQPSQLFFSFSRLQAGYEAKGWIKALYNYSTRLAGIINSLHFTVMMTRQYKKRQGKAKRGVKKERKRERKEEKKDKIATPNF